MITRKEIEEILDLYNKHGWEIGHVFGSPAIKSVLTSIPEIERLGDRVDYDSDINAIWFKRIRSDGRLSWEIRRLSSSPFALCESFSLDAPQEQIEASKKIMEQRIRERASK